MRTGAGLRRGRRLNKPRIACFVSPHGLGHAARAAAILAALQRIEPVLGIELYTLADSSFFEHAGCREISLHRERTDIGFAHKSALLEDIPETIRQLDAFLPFAASLVERLAEEVRQAECAMLLCDIAPLGIRVADAAGIPSVLVENFTWDNLYDAYAAEHPRMGTHSAFLRRWFGAASARVQCDPLCHLAPADLHVAPVSRHHRIPADRIRHELGVRQGQKLVLISMGGISERSPLLTHLEERADTIFVAASGAEHLHRKANVIHVPLASHFYHPDLVNAADLVIGKAGYSTIAEAYRAGVPFGYVTRPHYPENEGLVRFVARHMSAKEVTADLFHEGLPPALLDELLALPRLPPTLPNGADAVAHFLTRYFSVA